jgi:hypothetical protein
LSQRDRTPSRKRAYSGCIVCCVARCRAGCTSVEAAPLEATHFEVREKIRVSSSLDQHVEWLAADAELGFERLFLHNVHRDQEGFISSFAKKVLPALRT